MFFEDESSRSGGHVLDNTNEVQYESDSEPEGGVTEVVPDSEEDSGEEQDLSNY